MQGRCGHEGPRHRLCPACVIQGRHGLRQGTGCAGFAAPPAQCFLIVFQSLEKGHFPLLHWGARARGVMRPVSILPRHWQQKQNAGGFAAFLRAGAVCRRCLRTGACVIGHLRRKRGRRAQATFAAWKQRRSNE